MPNPPGLAFGGRVSPEKLAGGGWEERSELVQGWPVAKLGLDSETQNTEHSVISEADAETHTPRRGSFSGDILKFEARLNWT